jgi:hypothetical protein
MADFDPTEWLGRRFNIPSNLDKNSNPNNNSNPDNNSNLDLLEKLSWKQSSTALPAQFLEESSE